MLDDLDSQGAFAAIESKLNCFGEEKDVALKEVSFIYLILHVEDALVRTCWMRILLMISACMFVLMSLQSLHSGSVSAYLLCHLPC